MADLIPYEIQGIFRRPGASGMIDLADEDEIRANFYARTVYCVFAYDLKDAKDIAEQLKAAGRFDRLNIVEHRVRKWMKPKLDWDPQTGTTNFHE